MEVALAFVFGLLIGSFLNVCIYRLPRDLSVVRPRSFCPSCERMIAWYDNIPVVSFVLLRGRCRLCKSAIPLRYPLVELVTALLFAWGAYRYEPWEAVKFCAFSALLVALVGSDLEERTLPDGLTLGGAVLGLVLAWFSPIAPGMAPLLFPWTQAPRMWSLEEAVLGAAISSGAIWLVGELYYRLRKREGLGLGDVKMIAMIGAFLGLQGALLTLIVGSLAGGIIGLLVIAVTGRSASTYQLPFGAFLGGSALAVLLFGAAVLKWYTRMGT